MLSYEEYWRQHPYPSRGPARCWDAAIHRRPDREFVALCDAAEAVGMHVALDVSAQRFGTTDREYRLPGPLIVGIPERPQLIHVPLATHEFGRSLRAGAIEAHRQLAELLADPGDPYA